MRLVGVGWDVPGSHLLENMVVVVVVVVVVVTM